MKLKTLNIGWAKIYIYELAKAVKQLKPIVEIHLELGQMFNLLPEIYIELRFSIAAACVSSSSLLVASVHKLCNYYTCEYIPVIA